jgi:hypothetical protein
VAVGDLRDEAVTGLTIPDVGVVGADLVGVAGADLVVVAGLEGVGDGAGETAEGVAVAVGDLRVAADILIGLLAGAFKPPLAVGGAAVAGTFKLLLVTGLTIPDGGFTAPVGVDFVAV